MGIIIFLIFAIVFGFAAYEEHYQEEKRKAAVRKQASELTRRTY